MAEVSIRASKSTSFIYISEITRGSPGPAGQVSQPTPIAAGGVKVLVNVAPPYGWELCKAISRAGVKFDIDFSGMISINWAVLRLWSYNQGGIDTNGTAPQASPSTLAIGSMLNDWAEYPLGGYQPAVGNYKFKENYTYGNGYWGWGTIQDIGHRQDHYFGLPGSGSNVDFDVTGIVDAWRTGFPNYGFGLINITGGSWAQEKDGLFTFYGQDNATSAAWVPELIISYQTNTAPGAPIYMYPTGDQILTTTAPAMGFTLNDPDPYESINGSAIQVIADEAASPEVATWDQWFYNTYPYGWVGTNASFTYGTIPAAINKPLIPGRWYKWRAMCSDKYDVWSPWSGMNRFKVNGIPQPPTVYIDGAGPDNDLMTLQPNYAFAFVDSDPYDTDMHGYQVRVEYSADDLNWYPYWDTGDVDINLSPTTTASVQSATLEWGVDYRVQARVADSLLQWSSFGPWTYFQPHKTQEPIFMHPSGGAAVGYNPVFTAQRYQHPDLITEYTLIVTAPDGSAMMDATTFSDGISSDATRFTKTYPYSNLTAGVTYTWRCKIKSTIGGWSEWSAPMTFVVYDPTTPTNLLPAGDDNYDLSPPVRVRRTTIFDRVQYQFYPETVTDASGIPDDEGTYAVYASDYISSGITTVGGAGGYTQYDGSTPEPNELQWAMTPIGWTAASGEPRPGYYKMRARVSADAGAYWSEWNGLTFWKTDSSNIPTLISVAGDTDVFAWITDDTPDYVIASASDVINKAELNVYKISNLADEYWSSGFEDVPDGLGATVHHAGTGMQALIPGSKYAWNARMEETSGARSEYSGYRYFRLNGPPYQPSNIYPPNGVALDANIPFRIEATFDDPDRIEKGDYPTVWDVQIYEDDVVLDYNGNPSGTLYDWEVITGGLVSGHNNKLWTGDAPVLETWYQIRMRFTDSKGAVGPWSNLHRFARSTPPDGDIITPSNNSTVSTVTPVVTFSYNGFDNATPSWLHKMSHIIWIWESDANGNWLWPIAQLGPYYNQQLSQVIPAGYLQNNHHYQLALVVYNDKGLQDPTLSFSKIYVELDAPYPITGLDAVAFRSESRISLAWNQTSLKPGHQFIGYRVYRRKWYTREYRDVGYIPNIEQTNWNDWYAGNSTNYDYRVCSVTAKAGVGVFMESPDDTSGGNLKTAQNASDNWTLIGQDRAPGHVYDMIVLDESHNRPIQQEEFETLGADRKVIMRGFVLGNEGSITTLWQNKDDTYPGDIQERVNHTQIGRDLINYVTFNRGPHIIKSPFGDVWEAQFTSPEYRWLPTGALEITLGYVETGQTSLESD